MNVKIKEKYNDTNFVDNLIGYSVLQVIKNRINNLQLIEDNIINYTFAYYGEAHQLIYDNKINETVNNFMERIK